MRVVAVICAAVALLATAAVAQTEDGGGGGSPPELTTLPAAASGATDLAAGATEVVPPEVKMEVKVGGGALPDSEMTTVNMVDVPDSPNEVTPSVSEVPSSEMGSTAGRTSSLAEDASNGSPTEAANNSSPVEAAESQSQTEQVNYKNLFPIYNI